MARVVLHAKAKRDMKDIWEYISDHSSDERASAFTRKIEQKIEMLAARPLMGRSAADEWTRDLSRRQRDRYTQGAARTLPYDGACGRRAA